MKRLVYKAIFFRLMGWRIMGSMDPDIPKSVLMVMPHTSWTDFFVGLFARGIIGLEMHWVGKKELFRFPMDVFFRWMGGAPLDRTGGRNTVEAIAALFDERTTFRLAISPEGTREAVSELKSGFYYIAMKANVPIIPIAFDYGTKQVRVGAPFYPTADYSNDTHCLVSHIEGVTGRFPDKGFAFKK
ncbi:acyltransferase [Flavobacterium magnum]|uniref:Acyltransferase n=1 Tax=Flavobacterium magnum TaxID=2162713 RepID=A0A2S0RH73_9FLAO|nr:1-acyl-sn-glycerol-3-phosphate acyltransferase [Flavobacterium magnum]AWA30869.1 acyltransferase [Flavobacterium magnum]